jgi:hypothetical protein
MSVLASRAVNGCYWLLAIALIGVYGGLQSYGERERRDAIALFFPRPTAAPTIVEPTDSRPPDALAGP